MIRNTFMLACFSFVFGSVAFAQHGEFPWQVSLRTSSAPVHLALPAPHLPDGPIRVAVCDAQGHTLAVVNGVARNGEVVAALPERLKAAGLRLMPLTRPE